MSHHSDDGAAYLDGSDSFWEPGNYKKTTKRIDDGNKLCQDLSALVTERAEIEKNYAKALKQWAMKWNSIIEKGPEYGTMEAAWKAVLVEADRRCELHNKVKENLNIKANNQLKQWQKDNYHKSMMQIKEKKEMDDSFKKAQKPWAKLLHKVKKAKDDYYNACKAEKTAVNQERNASGDSALSQDQLRKLQDRVAKSKETVSRTRDQYELCLQDINNYNAKYMEDMTDVFERCQRMEAQRLQCFKEVLFTVQKCLNISEDPDLPQIYEEFYHTVNNADHEKDLRWWSNTHGVNMSMNWPQFEEYREEFREIAGKATKSKGGAVADGNITLIHQRPVGDDLPPADFLLKNRASSASRTLQTSQGGDYLNVGSGSTPALPMTTSSSAKSSPALSTSRRGREYNSAAKQNGRTNGHPKAAPSTVTSNPPPAATAVPPAAAAATSAAQYNNRSSDISYALQSGSNGMLTYPRPPGVAGMTPLNIGDVESSKFMKAVLASPGDDEDSNPPPAYSTFGNGGANPFGDDVDDDHGEWDDDHPEQHVINEALVDHGEPGVKVKALYDYEAAEDDELDLKTGDIFEKLEDEDEQGWCKGRKDGRVGLYPANYIEVVP